MRPAISVLMPVYNSEAYVSEAIESILNQSFNDFEFIIIDDASTDRTVDIIKTYTDDRIQLLTKTRNSGYTESLNMGLGMARGKYIARMDSDDRSLAQRFALQVKYMEANPDVMVLGSQIQIMGTDAIQKYPVTYEEVKVLAIMHSPVAHPAAFIRADVVHKFGFRYNPEFEPAEDYDLWARIIRIGKIENLPDVLLSYRRHPHQESLVKYERLVRAAFRTRVDNLKQLIDFHDKPYDPSFAVKILCKEPLSVNRGEIAKIACLINDMNQGNRIKHLLNDKLLSRFLRMIWLHYLGKMHQANMTDLSVLWVAIKSSITRVGLMWNLRFILKALRNTLQLN